MLAFFIYLVYVFFFFLLVFGLIQCWKNDFKAGFYFFLIIIILRIYELLAPFTTLPYFRSFYDENNTLPMGMTFGMFYVLIAYVQRIMEMIAFSFLVLGLYKKWKIKDEKKMNS